MSLAQKEIYPDESIEKLQEAAMAQIDTNRSRKWTYERLKDAIQKTSNKADEHRKSGDQKQEYIYLYIASSLLFNSGKKSEKIYSLDIYQKVKNDIKLKKLAEQIVVKLTDLESGLKDRYECRPEIDSSSLLTNGVDVADALPMPKSGPIKGITCKEMYDKLFLSPNNDHIVILQTRPQAESNKKRFHRLKENVTVIQIDTQLLTSTGNRSALLPQLDAPTRLSITAMANAKLVILVDESSAEMDDHSPLRALYNAFFKFVNDKDKITAETVFCIGGFSDWQISYQYFTTDSPISNGSTSSKIESNSYPIPSPTKNGRDEPMSDSKEPHNADHELPIKSVEESFAPQTVQPFVFVQPKPVTAKKSAERPSRPDAPKPVYENSPQPQVNKPSDDVFSGPESTKPVLNHPFRPEVNSAPAVDFSSRPVTARSPLDIPLRPGSTRISNDASGWSEASNRHPPHGASLPETSMITPPNANERLKCSQDASESVLKATKSSHSSGGLSRSYSSPNINDLVNEESAAPSLPSINRSIKPPALTGIRRQSFGAREIELICGLKNLGNTCYMNAILQCLAACGNLVRYFISGDYNEHVLSDGKFGSGGELARQLGLVFLNMSSNGTFAPSSFRKAVSNQMPSFTLGDQHDAHEFFTMLLAKLHADLNQAARDQVPLKKRNGNALNESLPTIIAYRNFYEEHISRNRSIFTEYFEGILLSNLKCSVCSTESDTFEEFTCLSLPIVTNGSSRATLSDCWSAFAADECLTGDAAWDCTLCKRKRNAIKRIRICRLPKILVIHLKRFSYHGRWREKLNTYVEFPTNLPDLSSYLTQSAKNRHYELIGIVNHMGTMEGGHYTAHCRSPTEGVWRKYNDQDVSVLSPADFRTPQAAYVLFYRATS